MRRLRSRPDLVADLRRIVPLAWPVIVGQVAVLAFATIDTVLAGRFGSADLAALAVGGAAYATIFVSLMGTVLAISPIVGQLHGAGREDECGRELHQAIWLALALSLPGCALLIWPQPFLAIAHASPTIAAKTRGYTLGLACALPTSLMFAAFRGFSNAVSRPKAVMAIQLGGLAAKLPLTALLVFGARIPGQPALALPALGAVGCGVATAIVNALQLALAWRLLRHDPFYARFRIPPRLAPPRRAALAELLRLGVPMGLSLGLEITGFTSMALFIARLGERPVAAHQIAVNVVSMMFMVAMGIASGTATLVAQQIGAGAPGAAARLARHGLWLGISVATALALVVFAARGPLVALYTADPAVAAIAGPLLAWVIVSHVADAIQTVAAFVLRACRIAVVPMIVYAVALWGVGVGGGYGLAFGRFGIEPARLPAALQGVRGFWAALTLGLIVAAIGMAAWMRRALRDLPAPPPRSDPAPEPAPASAPASARS